MEERRLGKYRRLSGQGYGSFAMCAERWPRDSQSSKKMLCWAFWGFAHHPCWLPQRSKEVPGKTKEPAGKLWSRGGGGGVGMGWRGPSKALLGVLCSVSAWIKWKVLLKDRNSPEAL